MPTQSNKIEYGLSDLWYVPITSETDAGVPTYGTPVALPGAISMNLSPQGERKPLSADNVEYFVATTNTGYEGDINLALIPDHFRQACMGEKTDAATGSHVTYETSDVVTQHFAVLGQFGGDYKNKRFVLYNCTVSRAAINAQTVDGTSGLDPSQRTDTVTLTVRPRRDNHMIRASLVDDGSETFANWFSGVYTPTVAS